MTTIADVAKAANVSKMTVSRVINHPEKVTDELKKLVYRAMGELDYQPNIMAKALANKRTQIIKLFILEEIDSTEPYYMNLLMGIARAVGNCHYSLQLVTKGEFDTNNCDGVIITGFRKNDLELIKSIDKPVVLFGENDQNFDFVDCDNWYGTRTTTKYAIETGYEQIVYIGMDVDESFEHAREKGYLEEMKQHQKTATVYHFNNHSTLSQQFIEKNWQEFLKNTCFICSTDRLAIGIERGIQKCGGSIPDDFGIIGFDGVFLDQISFPKMTTAKQPLVTMGEACGEMLIKKIEAGGRSQGYRRFLPELVVRESTKKAKESTT
ncbi:MULTISPECIES: LacI family DNA-binding transcriptional regulator [Enterococcus]|uniref:LacI family DNA-binding transcriptional regulator n=1 Tax=Enterococcus TaxID=1350 RepID=UPI0010F85198|nr:MULTISPECIES: LacI family DNA-binding transcriptional regulator [Enterococcus]KAF1302309.1 LacI family transcriptional regulator [Enterococcus sp. JM9B]